MILREDMDKILGEDFYVIVNRNSIVRYLQNVKALSFLPTKTLEWLAEACTKLKYQEKNEIVFSTSDHIKSDRSFYLVFKGSLELHAKDSIPNEEPTFHEILKPGDHFGEHSFFMGGENNTS